MGSSNEGVAKAARVKDCGSLLAEELSAPTAATDQLYPSPGINAVLGVNADLSRFIL